MKILLISYLSDTGRGNIVAPEAQLCTFEEAVRIIQKEINVFDKECQLPDLEEAESLEVSFLDGDPSDGDGFHATWADKPKHSGAEFWSLEQGLTVNDEWLGSFEDDED